jgi:hypothetical protein
MAGRKLTAVMFRPPRLNFALVCTWCLRLSCESPACVARHEGSWWAPCPDCLGWLDDYTKCGCWNGVVEATSQLHAEQLHRSRRPGPTAREARPPQPRPGAG